MKKVAIPAELAEALHRYLLGRPMGEVEALVSGLRAAEHVPVEQRQHDD